MKIKIFLMFIALCWLPLHAAPHSRYNLLESIAQLDKQSVIFARHAYLTHSFEYNMQYVQNMQDSFDTYDRAMRQMTVDLKGRGNRVLLNQFVEAKSRMKIMQKKDHFSENFKKLMDENSVLEAKIRQVTAPMTGALSAKQRALYALTKMQVQIERIALVYVAALSSQKGDKKAPKRLIKAIQEYEKQEKIRSRYADWSSREIIIINRIKAAWGTMKTNARRPGLPLLIDLGATHIDNLLSMLHAMVDEA